MIANVTKKDLEKLSKAELDELYQMLRTERLQAHMMMNGVETFIDEWINPEETTKYHIMWNLWNNRYNRAQELMSMITIAIQYQREE